MQISGNSLPVLSSNTASASQQDSLKQERPDTLLRNRHGDQSKQQQTAEYIFQGELLDDVLSGQYEQAASYQNIDPSNVSAITRYQDTGALSAQYSERQGQLLDIFI